MKIERKCEACGKGFWVFPSAVKYHKSIFCSKQCHGKQQSVARPAAKSKCLVCGKEFRASPSRQKAGYGKYCSRKCQGIFQSKSLSGKNGSNWKGGKKKIACLICGKVFLIEPSGKGKLCSQKCYGKWFSKMYRGEAAHTWKGGITSVVRRIRTSPFYKQWREQCFRRDKFTCQKCGDIVRSNLEVHHKKEQSKILEDVKKALPLFSVYDGAMLFAPLWDIDNGVTLCQKCHRKKGKVNP